MRLRTIAIGVTVLAIAAAVATTAFASGTATPTAQAAVPVAGIAVLPIEDVPDTTAKLECGNGTPTIGGSTVLTGDPETKTVDEIVSAFAKDLVPARVALAMTATATIAFEAPTHKHLTYLENGKIIAVFQFTRPTDTHPLALTSFRTCGS